MRKIILTILVITFIIPVFSQNDCVIQLRNAQKLYEDGILEEIPALLLPCIKNGFSKEEKADAYRLLVLCNLYEDEIKEAEANMLALLKTNPEYKINRALDAAEFIHLFNSFQTSEVLSVGVTIGTFITTPYATESFGTHNLNDNNTIYSNSGIGITAGPRISFFAFKDIKANFEVLYSQRKFEISTPIEEFNNVVTTESLNYLDIPISFSYFKFGNDRIKPYLEIGTNISYLLSAKSVTSRNYTDNSNSDITGKEIDIIDKRKSIAVSFIAGAGLQYHIAKGYFNLSVKYNLGLNTITNGENRYNDLDLVFKNFYEDDKIILNNLYIGISYMYPIYNHKKSN